MKVPYGYLDRQFEPAVADLIWQKIKPVVTRGDFTLGREVRDFEIAFANYMNVNYCIGVANGTDALELGLWALNLLPGSEVIVPCDTFIASAASIITAGHKPVFCDISEDFVIDAEKIEVLITENTEAIMPVHFGGQPCDMQKIMQIAKKHDLKVIEDTAQAAGAITTDLKKCGSIGSIAGVSFHPQKNLNCWGDGGVILTNDLEMCERLMLFRNHGMTSRDDYAIASRNSRLDTIQAVVLSEFLPQLDADNRQRAEVADEYDDAVNEIGGIMPTRWAEQTHTFHLYMFTMPTAKARDLLLKHLYYYGVDARVHYPKPLHLQPAFAHLGHKLGDFPVAEDLAQRMISLPIHQYMPKAEVEYVCNTLRKFKP